MHRIAHVGPFRLSFVKELYIHMLRCGFEDVDIVPINLMLAHGIKNKILNFAKILYSGGIAVGKIDLFFVEFMDTHAYYVSKIARHKRLVTRLHRTELYEGWIYRRNQVSYVAKNVDLIICVSKYICRRLDRLIDDHSPAVVVYNSIDPLKYRPLRLKKSKNKFIIGSLGSLIERKGFKELIFIARKLKRRIDFELHIAGKGPLYNTLLDMIERYSLKGYVYLDGYIPDNKLIDWYNGLDLFVLNSYSEGLPTVVLEAMSCGIPVIATNVGGVPEVLPEKYTYIPGNNDKLIELIEYINSLSPNERERIGLENRKIIISKFNIRVNACKILRYLKEIIELS